MIELKGNIWDYYGKATLCIPTNKIVNKITGALVMGKGLALECKQRFPSIEIDWGREVLYKGGKVCYYPSDKLIMFPTKNDYKKPSTLEILKKSLYELDELIDSYDIRDIIMPRIGCGNGGLDWEKTVKPFLLKWPKSSNITIISN